MVAESPCARENDGSGSHFAVETPTVSRGNPTPMLPRTRMAVPTM